MITPVFAVLTSALPSGPALDAVPEWIHFYGDLRIRLEENLDNDVAGNDRMRGRLRARFGVNFDISDELKAEVRLTTLNPGDANNVNIDIGSTGEGQAGAEAGIDRMNVTWLPCEDWMFKAGKMGNPFAGNPIWNEYTWDGDIQPAGVFGQWDISDDLDVRLAHFVVDEDSTQADASVTTAQVNFGMQGDDIDWALHTSVSQWSAADDYLASFAPGFVQTEDFMI